LLDSFVDAELPGSMLLEVARHAGSCPACDRAVREVTTLRESVERVVRREVEGVDLSGVWPAVERRIGRSGTRGVWRHVPGSFRCGARSPPWRPERSSGSAPPSQRRFA